MTARLTLLGILALGCGPVVLDDVDAARSDAGPAGPTTPIFDPGALDRSAGFFDLPFPSEARVDDDGRMDFSGFPQNRGLVAQAIAIVGEEPPGVSPLTGVYFRFSGPIDEGALPTPAESTSDESAVWILDVDAESPDRGARVPAYVRFQAESSRFWASNTLVVRAVPGHHLHPARRYAVVVRDRLGTERSATFDAIGEGATPLDDRYAALFEDLDAIGVARADVLVATAFRVSDPAAEMDVARAWLDAQPLPEVRGWRALSAMPDRLVLEATVDVTSLLDGPPPYTDFGSGRIAFEGGAPRSTRTEAMRIALVVPTAVPDGGLPVVVYGHGTGGNHTTHVGREGTALAAVGIATVGFEAAFHGGRATGGPGPETLVVSNPVAAREMIRQTVLDGMLLHRLIGAGALDPPTELTGDATITLAPTPVMFMGHSQGAQEGGLTIAVQPTLDAAFLSAGGAGGVITILERETTEGQPLRCLVAVAVGDDCEVFTEDHPALTLIVQKLLDPADPASFTHRVLRERPGDWAPLHLAMTEGVEDVFTPPRTTEAMAASIGLPIVAPVVMTTDAYALLGPPTVDPPVTANVTLPSGDVVTAGLLQYDDAGHFAIYERPAAEATYVGFFESAAAGTPTITP